MHNQNIWITGEFTEYFSEYKIRVLQRFCQKYKLGGDFTLLDFGYGIGKTEQFLFFYFPDVQV
ncbi:MAG: hypothetical protein NT009_13405 [Proteobacteria bacterium]|nr:hypothetical protein [Pseudomonadota bacterium]